MSQQSAVRIDYSVTKTREARRPPSRRVKLLVVTCVVTAGALLLVPSPVLVLNPGPTMDVVRTFRIEGVDTSHLEGRWIATTVRLDQPNLLGLGLALLRGRETIFPSGSDFDAYAVYYGGLADLEHSRILAAVAAAKAVGLPASVRGSGAEIVGLDPEGPAAGYLRPGDVIVSVGETPVRLVTDAVSAIAARPEGSALRVRVMRGGEELEAILHSTTYEADPEQLPRLGLELVTSEFSAELPFSIRFERDPEIVGPSAGLAFALAIADALDPADLAGGRVIAASGELHADGGVHPVGGLSAKVVAARHGGADLFVVPASIEREAGGRDLSVLGVASVAEAMAALLASGGSSR